MFPNLCVLNIIIPLYSVCIATGFLFGTLIVMHLGKKFGISENKILILMCFAEIGVIIGGKILFLLINIHNLTWIFEKFGFFAIFTKTGFVFYGGLFGGVIAVLSFSKIYKISVYENLSLVLSVTPLIHAFGRIGCLFAGCCYGIEWTRWSAIFLHDAYRFPVQLLEAALNLVLFYLLQIFFTRKKEIVISLYIGGYGMIRFFCEFFRGDEGRGFIGSLSVSAWISIMFIVMAFCDILIRSKNLLEKNRK